MGAVAPAQHGQAAGAAVALRELGGVLGVSVIAAVFAAHGRGGTASAFLAGARPALLVAALAVAAATVGALALPRRRLAIASSAPVGEPAPG